MATVEKRGKSYRITVAAGIDFNSKQIRNLPGLDPGQEVDTPPGGEGAKPSGGPFRGTG